MPPPDPSPPGGSGNGTSTSERAALLANRWADLVERCPVPAAGSPLTCAVSGGADSLALLVLAVAAGCDVTVVHVDHGLRPGGADEAGLVAEAATRFGARFEARRVEVAPGPNLEARARSARWSVLPPDAATGHTADDQAETVLLNLVRGAGLAGVAGMRPGARHPLLAIRRADTERVCATEGLTPVVDPTNVDPAHRRNRIRHEVLPLLDEVAGRDVVPLLARAAAQSRAAVDHLEAEAALAVPDPADVASLREAPPALASVALRRWLRSCSPEGHPPDAAALDRVRLVVAGEVRATEIGGGWRIARRAGRLVLEPPARAVGQAGGR